MEGRFEEVITARERLGVAGLVPAGIVVARAPRVRRRRVTDRYFTHVAILPTFVVMLCIFGIPLLFSLYLSFTGWSPGQALFGGAFVGLDNYQDLLADPVFVHSLGITFGYTAAAVAAQWRWAWASRCC